MAKLTVHCPICEWKQKVATSPQARRALNKHVHRAHSRSTAPVFFSDGAGGGRRVAPRPTLEDHDILDK